MDIPSAEDGGVMAAFEKSVAELPDEVTVLEKIKIEDYPISLRNQVFVSPDGDDSADGSIDSPLATLDAALKKMSGRNGAVIWLRGGVYMSDSSITVSDLASGTDVSPTFIAAYNGEAVTFSSGKKLSAKDFAHITDEKTRKRLDPKAAEKILVCDLAALGFNKADYGVLTTSDRPQLFVNGKSYILARYPNEGGSVIITLWLLAHAEPP